MRVAVPIVCQAEVAEQGQRRAFSNPRQLAVVQEHLAQTSHDNARRRRLRHLRVKQNDSLQQRACGQPVAPADFAATDIN